MALLSCTRGTRMHLVASPPLKGSWTNYAHQYGAHVGNQRRRKADQAQVPPRVIAYAGTHWAQDASTTTPKITTTLFEGGYRPQGHSL